MPEEFENMRRNIALFLTSLRRSIDLPYRAAGSRVTDSERDRFMRMMMMVEEARIRFDTYMRYREKPTSAEWTETREALLSFLNRFVQSDDVDPKVHQRRFIVSPLPSRQRDDPFIQLFTDREESKLVGDALVIFRSYVEASRVPAVEQGERSFADLERIVPHQQVAPVQFNIVDGRIVVSNRAPRTAKADRANIQSALEHISGSGEQLISNLESSNCDRRLLESVKELQSQLVSDGNIVKIGLINMACGVIGAQFHAELPDAIAGMLNAYNASISLYVAQFPEWEQFANKAASIDLDESDVARVDAAADEVIVALSKDSDLADPEVPKTIAFVRQFLSIPGPSSRRAAFAMIRTIENLVARIIRHSMDFLSKTAEKSVDAGSTAASKIIIGLLGIALLSAAGIGSTAVRAGAPWIKQAAEIVEKQIHKAME